LGDRRVTAKVLQLCGSMMADHSYNMLANSPDAPTLKIQLEKGQEMLTCHTRADHRTSHALYED
jgi:hypothetical protein